MTIRTVVLVEGRSDAAAVSAAAHRRGTELEGRGVEILSIGGAMSVGRVVTGLESADPTLRILGLCDAGERDWFDRVLPAGCVFVCDRDLEDELIRALTPAGVERVLATERDLERFRTFQNQPAQRGKDVAEQLHRFLGSVGGRKERYARVLIEALPDGDDVRPLADLLSALA